MTTKYSDGVTRGRLAMQSLFVAYLQANTVMVVLALVLGLGSAWGLSYLMGGSRTVYPHLFYVPIILAAVRSSWVGGLGTAIAAGLLAGPALPADVALVIEQPVEAWSLRLAIFVAVGGLVVALTQGHSESLGRRFGDSLASSRMVRAIQHGEVEVYYQPIEDTSTGRIVAFEALARWTGSRRGVVGPDEFIPPAERTGAVAALDRFVLREAAQQVQRWRTEIIPVAISVNVSAARFADLYLVADVQSVLAETGLAPQALQLEITESAVIGDLAAARRQLQQLRNLGVRVAIDDFGTGQSSLAYLDQFPADSIKIDRSLISSVEARPDGGRLVGGIIRMLRALEREIVAEGVETREQYTALKSMGCALVQGYHIGRPATTAETEELLRAEHATRKTLGSADGGCVGGSGWSVGHRTNSLRNGGMLPR